MNTLKYCRVLALESNHDVTMLREGEYPRFLQERILYARGHLSNGQDVYKRQGGDSPIIFRFDEQPIVSNLV